MMTPTRQDSLLLGYCLILLVASSGCGTNLSLDWSVTDAVSLGRMDIRAGISLPPVDCGGDLTPMEVMVDWYYLPTTLSCLESDPIVWSILDDGYEVGGQCSQGYCLCGGSFYSGNGCFYGGNNFHGNDDVFQEGARQQQSSMRC